jgi:hypothetical protein
MKRSAPTQERPRGFLTQKKIRSYLVSTKPGDDKTVTPLKETPTPVDNVVDSRDYLTAGLRFAMSSAVKYQLDVFKLGQTTLECALNKEHIEDHYAVGYQIRYFDDLCHAFLKMFSSYRRPTEFSEETGEFLPGDDTFHTAWIKFHQKRAQLRIVCHTCHLKHFNVPEPKIKKKQPQPDNAKPVKSINAVLSAYKEDKSRQYEHPWLDIKTWGVPNNKGNYTRKLGEKQVTLYQKNSNWYYVCDKQFGKTGYYNLSGVLQETYELYKDSIKRFV